MPGDKTPTPAPTGLTSLSEHASKEFLRGGGIPVTREALAHTPAQAAAREIGFPVAVKASGAAFAHKTELGLVELDLRDEGEVEAACARLASRAEGLDEFLVQEMVQGRREFIAGLIRDPQYGPAVMLGLGGVLAEALGEIGLNEPGVAEIDLNPVKLAQGRPVAMDALVVRAA